MPDTTTSRILGTERARLAPFIMRVSGVDVRESIRLDYDNSAGRFARGIIDAGQFREEIAVLIQRAAALSAQQDRDAGTVRAFGAGRRPGVIERHAAVILLAFVGALISAAFLAFALTGSQERPAPVPGAPVGVSAAWGAEPVALDMSGLPSPDCRYVVGVRDADGRPGGVKIAHVEIICP